MGVSPKAGVIGLVLTLIAVTTHGQPPYPPPDYPHTDTESVQCTTCHTAANIDDTAGTNFNDTCLGCHDGNQAVYVATHSQLKCNTCHWPHSLEQFRKYGSPAYVFSGTSDAAGITATTLTMTGAGWTGDQYQGFILIPNLANNFYSYKIAGNTGDTLTINGQIDLVEVTDGNTNFAIVYGKLVKGQISTPNSGLKPVKFFRNKNDGPNLNSFADGDPACDGVCEVCHTQTDHFRNDGNGPDQLHTNIDGGQAGKDCIDCHKHEDGFAHGGAQGGGTSCGDAGSCHGTQKSHPAHIGAMVGADCNACHDTNNFPDFADGQDLANTTVCNNCHSTNGVSSAKLYFETSGSWLAADGEQGLCGSCHDNTPGNSQSDGSGDDAFNVIGNGSTYGFFVTGHGKASGNYDPLSWQHSSASGNPAADKSCGDCHDLSSQHFNHVNKRLLAANDQDNTICNTCHVPGMADADPQFYTTSGDFEFSAHGDNLKTNPLTLSPVLCTDCHNVHGSSGANAAMTKSSKENLCFQCHTEGMVQNDAISNNRPGGHVSANDIQEAFGKSTAHDLGTSFSISGKTYTLQCISCHNVHLITGKYWEAEDGDKTPVTRFPPGDAGNLEAWGDESGEKMDDYAAQTSGTGGFYYKTAQSYGLGSTGLPSDQAAKYQPPKSGSGYNFEFGGDVLPDYTSLCLDCHTYRMSAANPPVNWGQGVGCTGNSVDPPNQRVECGAQHGFGVAGMPSYVSDEGTAGFWGSNGNPDVLFHMNYVTRGRHNGHFMRWPYDSAERSAGINFVMSCTDCHEAHGSNRGSMIRERFNVNDSGACGTGGSGGENCVDGGNWNSFCNACHYYYGGQHAGMSCGNASCHEANSIHRIIKNTQSGGTQLMLTASGYEGNYERPTFTPEIETVDGNIGSNDLFVTFRASQYGIGDPGIYTNQDLTGSFVPEDFWLIDGNGNNPSRTIQSVSHIAGETTAVITMSEPLVESDLTMDLLAVRPASIWAWYEGGYINAATGEIPEQVVSAGPWPVEVDTSFRITKVEGIVDSDKLYIEFSEGVYANPDGTGNLQVSDFQYVDVSGNGAGWIIAVEHTAGSSTAIITVNTTLTADDIDNDTVAAVVNSIFNAAGYPMPTTAVTTTALANASSISVVQGVDSHEKLAVWFSNRVYANPDATGALEPADFVFVDAGAGKYITAVDHTPGSFTATLTLNSTIEAADIGSATLAAEGSSIYDIAGHLAPITPVTLASAVVSSISTVDGVDGSNKLKVTFESQVYANDNETGALQPGDFIFTDNNLGGAASISSVTHTAGSPTAIITLNENLIATDIGGDTLAAVSDAIFGPSAGNFPLDTSALVITGQTAPAMEIVEGADGFNQLFVSFSQGVYTENNGTGGLQPGDFIFTDNNLGGAASISSVTHTAGSATAIVTVNTNLITGDIGNDTLAANGIFNSYVGHKLPD
jgi:predicted CXXCH cytochrome family protein